MTSFSARTMRLAILGLILGIIGWMSVATAQTVAVLALPDTSGTVNEVLRLPLSIADVDSAEAGEIWVIFDSTVVRPRHDSLEEEPFGAQIDATWLANTIGDTLRIVFASSVDGGYFGSGPLVSLEWELRGVGTSPLHFERIILERDDMGIPVEPPATGDDGSVAVEPVAVEAGTWGRVKHRFTRTP